MTHSSRRGFLTASAATALSGVLPLGLRNALAARPAGNSLSAVKHVVVFMQENRSFDHYFGTLQGVRGYGDPAALVMTSGRSVFTQPSGSGKRLPFHMDTTKTSAQCVADLDHSWTGTHAAVNRSAWCFRKTSRNAGGIARNGSHCSGNTSCGPQ